MTTLQACYIAPSMDTAPAIEARYYCHGQLTACRAFPLQVRVPFGLQCRRAAAELAADMGLSVIGDGDAVPGTGGNVRRYLAAPARTA